MLKGAIPYRDIYLQHGFLYNAGIPLLGAKLFGPTLSGVHTIGGYVEPLGVVAYYLIVAACRNRLLAAAFMLFLGPAIWMPSRAMFGMLSLAALVASIQGPKGIAILSNAERKNGARPEFKQLLRVCLRQGWPVLISGFLAMVAFMHSVDAGLFTLRSVSLFLGVISVFHSGIRAWRRALPISLFLVGSIIAILPFGLYLACMVQSSTF